VVAEGRTVGLNRQAIVTKVVIRDGYLYLFVINRNCCRCVDGMLVTVVAVVLVRSP